MHNMKFLLFRGKNPVYQRDKTKAQDMCIDICVLSEPMTSVS